MTVSHCNESTFLRGSVHKSEQIPVGSEQIPVGSEQIPVGSEQIPVGSEQILVGSEQIPVGSEQIPVGSEQICGADNTKGHCRSQHREARVKTRLCLLWC